MKHLGFTGTRYGLTRYQHKELFKFLYTAHFEKGFSYFHHGNCEGADEIAAHYAYGLGFKIFVHPPIDKKYVAKWSPYVYMYDDKDYLDRNKDIVKESDLLVACPAGTIEQLRSGTWATVRTARKQEIPVKVLYPELV